MIVNRVGVNYDNLYSNEEIFDEQRDVLEEDNLVITPQSQGNIGFLTSKIGNTLLDPNISVDNKFGIVLDVFGSIGEEFEKSKQEKKKLKRQVTQIQDTLVRRKMFMKKDYKT